MTDTRPNDAAMNESRGPAGTEPAGQPAENPGAPIERRMQAIRRFQEQALGEKNPLKSALQTLAGDLMALATRHADRAQSPADYEEFASRSDRQLRLAREGSRLACAAERLDGD